MKRGRLEGIEFSGAACPDWNGAGIRQEGTGLTLRSCYFHDNEEGILTGADPLSDVLIEGCEFDRNGHGDGYSHNIYIGEIRTFTLRYSFVHRAVVGHEVKSRAAASYLLYNRISNEDGTASRCVDLPNAGDAWLIGNLIEQGPNAENSNVFGFGLEGGSGTAWVVNNTFVNDRSSVRFIAPAAACSVVIRNNIFAGGSPIVEGEGTYSGDHNCLPEGATGAEDLTQSVFGPPGFLGAEAYDYRLSGGSICLDAGSSPGEGGGFDLTPISEYLHPEGGGPRPQVGVLDIGALEYRPPPLSRGGEFGGGAVFRDGRWAMRDGSRFWFGSEADIPVPADYRGEERKAAAVFRPRTGLWGIRGITRLYFGAPFDFPVGGDFDGDGTADVAIFRNAQAVWAIRSLTQLSWGNPGDFAVPGDYDGDGTTETAVFRQGEGLWGMRSLTRFFFGSSSDLPVSGDYDGDGTWEAALFRPPEGLWAVRGLTRIFWGGLLDLPIGADYGAGRGDEIGIFRRQSGLWAVKDVSRFYFGGPRDIPLMR
ncbi:MAG: hypothetical protein NTV79_01340 [Candidatus Aureabacteria bacterium]|nr:hypothetical protein [Candidatus Auribacterota bacterium]